MKSRKRKFNLSKNLQEGIAETINLKETSDGQFRDTVITLSRIEVDPDNPRQLAISLNEILSNETFEEGSQKQKDLEQLTELASTIEANGVLNPIVVYRFGEKYRIVAGERRFLASNIAKKHNIAARVYNNKPDTLQLKVVQWVENTSREDLSLSEKINNIESIIKYYKETTNDSSAVNAEVLSNITGLSLTNTYRFLLLIKSDKSVRQLISSGKLNSMQMAEMLAGIKDKECLKLAIEKFLLGASFKEVQDAFKNHMSKRAKIKGKKLKKVSFGDTKNTNVARIVIEAIANDPRCKGIVEIDAVDWNDIKSVSNIMKNIIRGIEAKVEHE